MVRLYIYTAGPGIFWISLGVPGTVFKVKIMTLVGKSEGRSLAYPAPWS